MNMFFEDEYLVDQGETSVGSLHVQVQSVFSFEALVALLALEDLVLAGWFVWILVRAFL